MNNALKALHLESRGVLRLSGKDCRTLLQGLITNDLGKLGPRAPLYAALLTPQGKYLFDFFILEDGADLLLDCEADRKEALIQRLSFYKLRADVTISDVSDQYKVYALMPEGPEPGGTLPTSAATSQKWTERSVYPDPRHAGMGFRAVLKRGPVGVETWSFEDYEDLRLSLGIPDGARDIEVDKRFILEANLADLNGVDFDKGCYVGQEMTARMNYRGTLKKRLLPATIEGPLPAPGTEFFTGGKAAGHILSGQGNRVMTLARLGHLGDQPFETKDGTKVSVFTPDWIML
ncbi:MAG: CAF17-like 4Fe-4S cluster assembly/insertion protein YgfZ [Alphaproteobacteria bacterium]